MNTRLFEELSIADFFVCFTSRKVSSQEGKSRRFVAPDQSRKISLQDSASIHYKDVYDVAPVKQSICFSHC